jgi:hypothetical protein
MSKGISIRTVDLMDSRIRSVGRLTAISGLAGTALSLMIIAWPDQVPDTRWSFPFAEGSYIGAQVLFALQHALLVPGLVVVSRLARSTAGRVTRVGLVLTIVFTAISSVIELAAIAGAGVSATSATADALGMAYGVMTLGVGVGFILAGIAFVRRPVLPGAIGRWVYLAIGVWTFFPMLPSLFMPLVWGRIAIGTWYLMYAGIGFALIRLAEGQRDRSAAIQAHA